MKTPTQCVGVAMLVGGSSGSFESLHAIVVGDDDGSQIAGQALVNFEAGPDAFPNLLDYFTLVDVVDVVTVVGEIQRKGTARALKEVPIGFRTPFRFYALAVFSRE
ncbi:MAG: hypothetical protein Q8L64_06785 [bacterium]|nr:hypothetical protein [bacterium]